MADDSDSGDMGEMDGGFLDNSGATSYGGGPFANNERGPYSFANINASSGVANYSNTGAPGSQPLPETWSNQDARNQEKNLLYRAPDDKWRADQAAAWNARSNTQEAVSTPANARGSAMGMLPKPETLPKEEKPPSGGGGKKGGSGLPGQDGNPPRVTQMAPFHNPYAVERARYPFTPQIPIAGSGVKRAFFTTQEDLLKQMMPGWMRGA